MNLRTLLLFVLSLGIFGPVWSQVTVSGKVVDAQTGEPISFAAILVRPQERAGVVAGLDGSFTAKVASLTDSFVVTCLGYAPLRQTWAGTPVSNGKYVISLNLNEVSLNQVEIMAFRDPGEVIMRRVIKNRKQNDPEQLPSYQCRSYSKFVFDFMPATRDTTGLSKEEKSLLAASDTMNLMIMESVSERKFLYPSRLEEKIVATKVSGLKRPNFAALATDLQPFSFYSPFILLIDQTYVSPLHPRNWNQYDYLCLDTLIRETDSVYHLEFKPKNGLQFQALAGFLHISSNGYALIDIQARPASQGPSDIQIQQIYDQPDGTHWFPQALLVSVKLNYPTPTMGMQIYGESFYRDVAIGKPMRPRDFSMVEVSMTKDAAEKKSGYWDSVRVAALDIKEVNTYQFMDSIGEIAPLDEMMTGLESIAKGYIPIGKIGLPLDRLGGANLYEGFRLGLGIRPVNPWLGRIYPEVWAAYGFRDKAFKYGASLELWIDKTYGDWKIDLSASQDVEEIGRTFHPRYPLERTSRSLIAQRMDSVQLMEAGFSGRLFRAFTFRAGAAWNERQPTYDVQWNGHENAPLAWGEIRLQGRLAIGEKYTESLGMRIVRSQPWPVLEGLYIRGLADGNDLVDFQRAELRLSYTWESGLGAQTRVVALAGKVWGDAPLARNFFLPSVRSEQIGWLFVPNHFQTAGPYEWASDEFAALFFTRRLGIHLFKSKYSSPQPEFSQHIGFGRFSGSQNFSGMELWAPINGLYETGLMLHNLVQMNYVNLGYLGMTAGVFMRWGPHSLPGGWQENAVFKAGISFRLN